MQELIRQMLAELGEDPKREGLAGTPRRVESSLRFLTSGYAHNPVEVLNGALFSEDVDEIIVVRDIDIFSLCEHHLLPFYGRCHVGYLPNGKIVGLSKIVRLVEVFARRLQVQERLTRQIAQSLLDQLEARGVGVVIDAFHLCMMMRGVEKQNSHATTSCMLGTFRSRSDTRAEFLRLITAPTPRY